MLTQGRDISVKIYPTSTCCVLSSTFPMAQHVVAPAFRISVSDEANIPKKQQKKGSTQRTAVDKHQQEDAPNSLEVAHSSETARHVTHVIPKCDKTLQRKVRRHSNSCLSGLSYKVPIRSDMYLALFGTILEGHSLSNDIRKDESEFHTMQHAFILKYIMTYKYIYIYSSQVFFTLKD